MIKILPQINCDLGEGIPQEENIFPWIDAASIACGGHFGNEKTIRNSLKLALKFNVKVGAHPSYPDPDNFGRKSLQLPFEELAETLLAQIGKFSALASEEGIQPDHIKFHGALYNDAAKNNELASDLSKLLLKNFPQIPVFVPPFSEMEIAAIKIGLKTRLEVFGDRTYQDNYLLAPRTEPKALLVNSEDILIQINSVLTEGQLISSTGNKLPIVAETICFHGDNPGIQNFLPLIRKKFWANKSNPLS
ncbi:LamB/YcsF family protein [Algoriphagus mannitolivorans]|uniref:LamB/YcsF family protein n=1 Tax=Algoriphagus mannitolivorans TaxID=226504 RepID=UPI00042275C2|nr:LamB/YcsF family protein [Algoriphagus mannitolivorans]